MSIAVQHSGALSIVNRAALRHAVSAELCNRRVKTVEEIRLERLRQLKDQFGTLVKLNEALGLGARDSTLSQILNASEGSKTKKPKVMGSPMARRLEEACKKPRGWMDNDPDAWPFEGIAQEEFERLTERQKGEIEKAIKDEMKALIQAQKTESA